PQTFLNASLARINPLTLPILPRAMVEIIALGLAIVGILKTEVCVVQISLQIHHIVPIVVLGLVIVIP
ncbi:hypothetical protein HDR60_03845, partial [bacterium]|nr:hypothetical protein [bacterium]